MRDVLGITGMAQYMDGLMPGSITSPASTLIRAIGIPLVAGAKMGPAGLIGGLAVSALLGGTGDLTKSGEQTKEEYFGQRRVPIRSGRYWPFGSESFFGSAKAREFVPNWYRRLMSRYQYTDVQYGSELEYWSNILDPYHYAVKHYLDRPYPVVTSGVENVPFIGPLLGGILDRPLMMHTDYLNSMGGTSPGMVVPIAGPGGYMPGVAGGVAGVPGIGGGTGGGIALGQPGFVFAQPYRGDLIAGMPEGAQPYGVNPFLGGLSPDQAAISSDLQARTGEQIYRMTEYMGLHGFMINMMKEQLTGEQDFFLGPQLESAERITSAERAYWEQNFGDPGYTEFFRRFLPHRRHNIEYINQIPNQLPSFLPGQEYFQNFRLGDPMSQIDFGEIRLPGAGYEKFYTPGAGMSDAANQLGAINAMYASSPGWENYGPMDVYRILADVAPWSQQFRYSQQYIMALSKLGMLTPEADEERKLIKKEVSQRKQRYNFVDRRFTRGELANEDVTVSEYLGHGKFLAEGQAGRIYQMAGLKSVTPEGEAFLKERLTPGTSLTVQTLDDPRYRTKTTTVTPTVPVLIGGLNREMINKDMAQYRKTGPGNVYSPMNTAVEYNWAERQIGAAWENLSHLDLPYFSMKALRERTALEEYERTQVYGRDSASWSHPIRDFASPVVRKLGEAGIIGGGLGGALLGYLIGCTQELHGGGKSNLPKLIGAGVGALFGIGMNFLTGNDIPAYRQEERDINQYFDILKYMKYQALYSQARAENIALTGEDPEEFVKTLEASRKARKVLGQRLDDDYSWATIRRDQARGSGNTYALERAQEQRNQIQAAQKILQYQGWTEQAAMSAVQGTPLGTALRYREQYLTTMYGADVHGPFNRIMGALPTKEREFFQSFIQAPAEDRSRILQVVPLGMRRFLEAKWGMPVEDNPNLEEYFKTHYLPGEESVAWDPGVNLDDIKIKTMLQKGLDLHDVNLWESQARELKRKPYVPLINPFSATNTNDIKQQLSDILKGSGYSKYNVNVLSQPGVMPRFDISFDVRFANNEEAREYIHDHLSDLMDPSNA